VEGAIEEVEEEVVVMGKDKVIATDDVENVDEF
jgi:hypothetical protein